MTKFARAHRTVQLWKRGGGRHVIKWQTDLMSSFLNIFSAAKIETQHLFKVCNVIPP